MSKPVQERKFTLRALLMWTVNDFPAYGLLSGQQVHGYKGCPLCGPETCAEHASLLGKMIYLGGRRYLHEAHRFRRARASFNGEQEWQLPPERPIGEEVLRWGTQRSEFLRNGGVENSDVDPVKLHGVKRRSIFFDLPYWKVRLNITLGSSNSCFAIPCEFIESIYTILMGKNTRMKWTKDFLILPFQMN